MPSQPRRLLLRQSLLKPVLWFGGDRVLTAALWAAVLMVVFMAHLNFRIIVAAVVLGAVGQFVLQRWAKADPLFWPLYRRSLTYNTYYPAHGSRQAKGTPPTF